MNTYLAEIEARSTDEGPEKRSRLDEPWHATGVELRGKTMAGHCRMAALEVTRELGHLDFRAGWCGRLLFQRGSRERRVPNSHVLGCAMKRRIRPAILAVLASAGALCSWADARTCPPATGHREVIDLSGPGWKLWFDRDAAWKDDAVLAPPVDLARVPSRPPTGGWERLAASDLMPVAVPGTVEEYLGTGKGPDKSLWGVSWWTRALPIPADVGSRRVLLHFGAVRQRAEIYLDRVLVGYDQVDGTPFTVDLTRHVKPGSTHQLAVRITNPGGSYDWQDFYPYCWGNTTTRIPLSHAFSGIYDAVRLELREPVAIADLAVFNTADPCTVTVRAEIENPGDESMDREVELRLLDAGKVIAFQRRELSAVPGTVPVEFRFTVPTAKLWDLDTPVCYTCEAVLSKDGAVVDGDRRTFGFRSFFIDDNNGNTIFRLNGRRIVLRTAISWGFWPINGLYPTPELAERNLRTVKAMGQNMLSFHRCIGQPLGLDLADKMGVLYYEEPGGYVSVSTDPIGAALAREKLLRMVRRDRSHPSLVIYNMINEWSLHNVGVKEEEFARHRADIQAAHALDPSRTITHTSAWATEKDVEQRAKMHMRPYDTTVHMRGWYDNHNAGGPVVWDPGFYTGPNQHYRATDNRREIEFYGEEGAISSPPRLALIAQDLASASRPGWDAEVYRDWHHQFVDFMDRKDLKKSFADVDALTTALSDVSHWHQGRKIEMARMHDVTDGYAVNGWEAELIENHSGVVDCFRFPKSDPALMAWYNQPCYVAVWPRSHVVAAGKSLLVDFHAINEINLKGPHTLSIALRDAAGKVVKTVSKPVTLTGGEVYGQLLVDAIELPFATDGLHTIEATLVDAAGTQRAQGRDEVLSVDSRLSLSGTGAVLEAGDDIQRYLKTRTGVEVPAWNKDLRKLDWLVIGCSMKGDGIPVPAEALRGPDGVRPGLDATYFRGVDFNEKAMERVDTAIDFNWPPEAGGPDGRVGGTNYSVRWKGTIVPPKTGTYSFIVRMDDGARLWIDNKRICEDWKAGRERPCSGSIALEAGKPVSFTLEFFQLTNASTVQLRWLPPGREVDVDAILKQVRADHTALVVLEDAASWCEALKPDGVKLDSTFPIGDLWLGGQYFVQRDHPLFAGLPTGRALDRFYTGVVPFVGSERFGMHLEGEDMAVGCWQSWPFHLGTAVATTRIGTAPVVLSALRIRDRLNDSAPTSEVARRLLGNYLEFVQHRR